MLDTLRFMQSIPVLRLKLRILVDTRTPFLVKPFCPLVIFSHADCWMQPWRTELVYSGKCTAISFLQKLSWIWFFPESLGVDILFFLCTFATNNRRYRTQRKKCGTISLSRKTKESLLALAWREIALLRSYFLHIAKTGVSWKEENR